VGNSLLPTTLTNSSSKHKKLFRDFVVLSTLEPLGRHSNAGAAKNKILSQPLERGNDEIDKTEVKIN